MSDNTNLNKANAAKNDEFYTPRAYVDQIIDFMKDYLKGKKVYCNCDMPWSAFVNAFIERYDELGLAGLKCTGMDGKDFHGTLTEYDGKEVRYSKLQWSGSFDSYECVDILNNWCDVCISNPPFSIKTKYYNIMKYSFKKFLFIAPMNIMCCKQLLSDYIEGKVNFVYSDFFFDNAAEFISGNDIKIVKNVLCTNIDELISYRLHKLTRKLDASYKFLDQEFEGKPVLNIDRSDFIPVDYAGYMAIPVTPMATTDLRKRFRVYGSVRDLTGSNPSIDGKNIFERIIVRNRNCDSKPVIL